MTSPTSDSRWSKATLAALVLGTVLRLVQYFAATSMWFDELALARSIDERSLASLLSAPLDHAQVAPTAFVAALKLTDALPGPDELGLRLLPTIAAIAALFLFRQVAVRVLTGAWLTAAVLAMAISPALIWFGGNVKPYAGDVAIGLALVLLTLRHVEQPNHHGRARMAGLIGALLLPFSFSGVLTAAVLGGLLTLRWWLRRQHDDWRGLAQMVAPWAIASAAVSALALARVDADTQAYMNRFWGTGFMPAPWQSADAALWAPRALLSALGNIQSFYEWQSPTGLALAGLAALFAFMGVATLARRTPWLALVVAAPVLAALFGAAAHRLPFQGRVGLHAAWPLLLLAFVGVQFVTALPQRLPRLVAGLAGALLAIVPAAIVLTYDPPPFRGQETRPVLQVIAARAQPDDAFYAYYGARHAIAYYGKRTSSANWQIGACHRDDTRAYFRELDAYRGTTRLWVLFSHAALGYREPEVIRAYLSTIGVQRDSVPDPFGMDGQEAAYAYLFDLSDSTRAGGVSAETFVFDEVKTGGMRILCDGTRIVTSGGD